VGLVEEMWEQLYPRQQGALAKLENLLPDEQRYEVAWARRSLLATGMHRADFDALAPILEKLRRAAREHRRVQMLYQGRSQAETSQRDIDPYALVHRWGWWYMVGYCHLRKAVRTFRIDRIAELNLLAVTFDAAVDFNLRSYLASELQTQPHKASLRFDPQAARAALENQPYWESVQEQADGGAGRSGAIADARAQP
jgi:predicted DNA-binding transcriptional regulator YafY